VTAAVVSLIATVIGFVVWYWRRKLERTETREQILERYENEARRAVAKADSCDVNALLDDRLRAIGRNTSGSGNLLAGGGQGSSSQRLPSAESADAGDSGRVGKP
jgi:Flp pilus assembly protein TadB